MGLYHVHYSKSLDPLALERGKLIKLLRSRLNPRTFEKMVRIFDEQIANAKPSQRSALTFAMLATLVGYNSVCPTGDSNYVWEKVFEAAKGHQKVANLMLGSLAQWRFANDSRNWLCARQDTGKINEDNEDIYVTIYWIKSLDEDSDA